MRIDGQGVAGKSDKSDLRVTVSPGKGREIELSSSVGKLYSDRIMSDIESELDRLGIDDVGVIIEDDGALPYVLSARIEAAVAAATGRVGEPNPSAGKREVVLDRLRRSRLYIPGNSPRLFNNAWLFGADILLLDLEDAVPPVEKPATRYLVRNALISQDFGDSELAVRINPLSSPFGEDDLEVVVPAGPELIVLPKAESAGDIETLLSRIAGIQKRAGTGHVIGVVPLIETALGVIKASEIASVDGVVMLAFGAEDFTRDIGAKRSREGKEQFVARSNIVLAAKAYGRMASDTVFSDLADEEGLIVSTEESKMLGFDGRGLINPGQIEPVHKVFAPTGEEIEYAVRVVVAAEKAEASGGGVIALGRKMIDPPVVSRAKNVLLLAEKMGIDIPEPE